MESIECRRNYLMSNHKERLIELIKLGWKDIAIANYLGSDILTIKRAKKQFINDNLMI